MNCPDRQLDISSYIDGELSRSEASAMFVHLSQCADCRTFFTTVLALRSRLHALGPYPVPASLDLRVLQAAHTSSDSRSRGASIVRTLWSRRFTVPLPAAATLALVVLAATIVSLSGWFRSGSEPQATKVVYMLSLPPVEVHAPQSTTPATIQ